MSAPRRGTPPTVVVRSDYGLPYSKGLMAQSLMATGLPSERSFALAQQIEERLVARRSTEISVDELRARGGGGRRRGRERDGAGALPAVVERAQPGAAAARAARRRDRRREVHGRHAAGRAARDPARDRHRPGAPGRARVLLARVPAVRAPLVVRRVEGAVRRLRRTPPGPSPASCARPTTSPRGSMPWSSARSRTARRWWSRECTCCPTSRPAPV